MLKLMTKSKQLRKKSKMLKKLLKKQRQNLMPLKLMSNLSRMISNKPR